MPRTTKQCANCRYWNLADHAQDFGRECMLASMGHLHPQLGMVLVHRHPAGNSFDCRLITIPEFRCMQWEARDPG